MQVITSKIQKIRKNIYSYSKDSTLPSCYKHDLPTSMACLQSKCSKKYLSMCKECSKEMHMGHSDFVFDIREIVPKLQKYLDKIWSDIQREDKILKNGYRKIRDNLQYCIDLFTNLKAQFAKEDLIKGVDKWNDIMEQVCIWFEQQFDPARFIRDFKQFHEKHGMVIQHGFKNVSFDQAKLRRDQAIKKQQARINKINNFVDSALIFSSDLEALQQQRKKIFTKREKIQFNVAKILSLEEYLQKKQEEADSKTDQLLIALKEDSKDQAIKLGKLIERFSDLRSIQIRGDKVKLREKSWEKLLNYFPNLIKLKQMRLTLKSQDLQEVGKIFEKWIIKLRPIDRFHLKISDSKSIDIYWVYTICNCFSLSGLWITIIRCGLTSSQCKQLINKLKINTSLTNLPLSDWHMNLVVNKIQSNERASLEQQFDLRSRLVTKKSFQI